MNENETNLFSSMTNANKN